MSPPYKELFKLYDLIQSGEPSSVSQFLSRCCVDLNHVLPSKGIGVLHLAVGVDPEEKAYECTEMLLKYGADPNLCTDDLVTPVHIAAIWGRARALRLLLGCGGDAGRRDAEGCSAFDYAAAHDQWGVFDYLHNVEDQLSEGCGAECAYEMDLDKVIMTTEDLSAEYEPAPDPAPAPADPAAPEARRSQAVRDWCDAASLVVNQLYPTVLGDSCCLDEETEPWRSESIPLDCSGTDASYHTCLSRKVTPEEIMISGVHRLDDTGDCPRPKLKPRLSVYENFSLPGSPDNITHVNYNSKTRLRSKNISEHFRKLSLRQELDQQLDTVAQNKTNERLSHSERRSSSGVSSYAGGVAVARVREVYSYTDREEGVVLTETRDLVAPVVLPVEDGPSEHSIVSVASSLPGALQYDNARLREELVARGFAPGPVHAGTRRLYLRKLRALQKNPIVVQAGGKTYSVELEKSLRDPTWSADLSRHAALDARARHAFASPRRWREGGAKTSFTYLLLDPRVTSDLPGRAAAGAGAGAGAGGRLDPHECWRTFIDSIFYVGKGKRSRPYSHLYQALTLWKRDFTSSKDRKVNHILDIWRARGGVVCLHVFQNVIPAEAYTYEAAMIDVLGVSNLKNLKCGNYYGEVAAWPLRERRLLGLYLLFKAMNIFLSEGERQLRPDDVD